MIGVASGADLAGMVPREPKVHFYALRSVLCSCLLNTPARVTVDPKLVTCATCKAMLEKRVLRGAEAMQRLEAR